MSGIHVSPIVRARSNIHNECDNGCLVRPIVEMANRSALNQALWLHLKEPFRYVGQCQAIAAVGGAGARARWRGKFHTSTHTGKLGIKFTMALQRAGAGDPYATCTFSGGLEVASFHYGNTTSGSPAADYPSTWGHSTQYVACLPDTDYEFIFEDHDNGRLISATIFEVGLFTSTENGYLYPTVAVLQPILDKDRADVHALATAAWNRNAAHVFNWTVDTDAGARTRTSATDINLIDNTSTAISAATPGMTLDLRYRNSYSASTVAAKLWVYGRCGSGGPGHVYLKDASGVVQATVNINSSTNGWYSADVNFKNTFEKYDLHYDSDGVNTTTLYAVSCYLLAA